MFVADTTVLVYAANRNSDAHVTCRALLETWRAQATPWFLTWNIVYEFLRVTTHPRVLATPSNLRAARGFIAALLASSSLEVLVATRRNAAVLEQTISELPELRGNLIHDLHTAVLMREHGVGRIVMRNTDFHRFSLLTVVDPLR